MFLSLSLYFSKKQKQPDCFICNLAVIKYYLFRPMVLRPFFSESLRLPIIVIIPKFINHVTYAHYLSASDFLKHNNTCPCFLLFQIFTFSLLNVYVTDLIPPKTNRRYIYCFSQIYITVYFLQPLSPTSYLIKKSSMNALLKEKIKNDYYY